MKRRRVLHKRYGRAASGLAAAVKAMRLYLGSVDFASVRAQQRLFDRAARASDAVASSCGLTTADAWAQITHEARRLGIIRPIPGRDI